MTLISSIQETLRTNQNHVTGIRLVVVKAAHQEVIECVKNAINEGISKVIFIDSQEKLLEYSQQYQLPMEQVEIIDEADDQKAAMKAVEIIRNGEADAIMKGHISTGKLLKAVVDKEKGIRKSPLLSHVAVLYVPKLDRLIAISDGGMVLQPTKEEMEVVIRHAVDVYHSLGKEVPKVALLSCAETVIPKLASSTIADEIVKSTKMTDCIIEGPLSIDISLSPEIAEDKGYQGKIQGDADIIISPDIVSGNSLSKSLILFGESKMAGLILGASVPIILTSRSSSAEEKFASILLARNIMASKET
ncbi:phosphate butyryltransferase [Granulicatella balaenopterae]|uniref:Phosphate butyryltransferase n=1 Tax=Granulicatella balaenopterae TaxID=137733 RepID=A0A1H9HE77_9LACT|nr:phosphate acyltransferase [Granulicatella balaenopterae]SEQ60588.1 phosphate butyryltransferase [Granulicatella balaenopterae]